ncbi:MAG: hypothetical protein V4662_27630 [Verrucomicrobiota bacterium]
MTRPRLTLSSQRPPAPLRLMADLPLRAVDTPGQAEEEQEHHYTAVWFCQQCGRSFKVQVRDSQEAALALASLALEDHLEGRHSSASRSAHAA